MSPTAATPSWTLALRWHVQKHLEIFARAENLLDEHYQEAYGYPALAGDFTAGCARNFN